MKVRDLYERERDIYEREREREREMERGGRERERSTHRAESGRHRTKTVVAKSQDCTACECAPDVTHTAAQHSTAQHSTARHSTAAHQWDHAQHSTAQHSSTQCQSKSINALPSTPLWRCTTLPNSRQDKTCSATVRQKARERKRERRDSGREREEKEGEEREGEREKREGEREEKREKREKEREKEREEREKRRERPLDATEEVHNTAQLITPGGGKGRTCSAAVRRKALLCCDDVRECLSIRSADWLRAHRSGAAATLGRERGVCACNR